MSDGPPACRRHSTFAAMALSAFVGLGAAPQASAEGSRTLYPSTYPTSGGTCANTLDRGCRANLDL